MDESQYFNESHHAVRDMVRRFAREEVAPIARQFDESGTFPWETVKKMGDLGLLGMPWDEELGGAGFDLIGYLLAIYEMAKVDASHAITISAHTTLGTSPIVNFGSEAQKRRFVPLLATGRVLGGFGLTEEAAGSDAGGTRTTAVRRGDRWILNGSKRFITHGGVGEIFVVTAQTDPSKGTKGITSFILTKESCDPEAARRVGLTEPSLPRMAGFKAGRKEDKLGWRASDTRELIFEDVEVPDENVLGQPGMGFTNFMRTLDAGRIGIAALSLGLAEGAFEEALRYAHVRKQFGKPIYDFQGVSFPLADRDDLAQINVAGPELLLGDIILAHGVCEAEAAERGIGFDQHATHLIVHGTLHLLGYDHHSDDEASDMEAREIRALGRLGIANPYEDAA